MNREVRSLEEALEVLIKLNVSWVTVCRAQNSICDVVMHSLIFPY